MQQQRTFKATDAAARERGYIVCEKDRGDWRNYRYTVARLDDVTSGRLDYWRAYCTDLGHVARVVTKDERRRAATEAQS